RDGRIIAVGDAALRDAVTALRRGEIVALKGLGGYQLLVRADDEAAVTRLRARKRRPRKPLALLVASLEEARALARIDDDEARALRDPAGPIVLARRRGDAVAAAVAPGQRRLGLMLPTTPLHALLARGVDAPLVCTSGNVHEEPMCVADADARARLGAIADCFLGHDREILRRADDSVVQLVGGRARTLRAARGLRPRTLALPGVGGPTLALGGHLKQAPALWVDGRVALWPELGDLDTPRARDAMIATIADVEAFLGVRAERVAHDAHPDFATTIWAEQSGRSSIPVWHHHAHVAAVLAEHGRAAALGFAWDGYGRGADAGLWGGETLEVDRRRACRVGHLRSFPLVGGDAAARDGRRALVGLLVAADLELPDDPALRRLAAAASRPGAPRCTSVGRLFDGVAALTGVAARSTYEGEAAMMLEAIAEPGAAPYPFSIAEGALDWRPALSAMLCERDDAALVASRLHATLIAALVEVAARRRAEVVALAGGCFQNALLLGGALDALAERGVEALAPEAVPPGDGGLALGQAWVASGGLSCV
ncbi:MAG: carbamoyltransferase HypF, partial [Myxococcales bacterium]|nr:carbamoyltransferase HypF [Myxococcales bacterium]